jgi:hypothetical protein
MPIDEITAPGPLLRDSGISSLAEAMTNKRQHAAELRAWVGRADGPTSESTQTQADRLDADAGTRCNMTRDGRRTHAKRRTHRKVATAAGNAGDGLVEWAH